MNLSAKPIRNRRSIRLPGFDYASAGAYFFTLVTQDRRNLFGRIVDDMMLLNAAGRAVMTEWRATSDHRPYVELDEFVVMPNYMHAILWILDTDRDGVGAQRAVPLRSPARRFSSMAPDSLPAIIRAFKSATTRRINQLRHTPSEPVWQRNYFERVIRKDRELHDIRQYIIDNPARWALDHENPARTTMAPWTTEHQQDS